MFVIKIHNELKNYEISERLCQYNTNTYWKHEVVKWYTNQSHLVKDRTWLSWEWPAQWHKSGGRLTRHMALPSFFKTSHETSKQWYWNGWSRKVGIINTKSLLHAYTNYVQSVRTQSLCLRICTLSMLPDCPNYSLSVTDFVSFFSWNNNVRIVVTSGCYLGYFCQGAQGNKITYFVMSLVEGDVNCCRNLVV